MSEIEIKKIAMIVIKSSHKVIEVEGLSKEIKNQIEDDSLFMAVTGTDGLYYFIPKNNIELIQIND